MTREMREHLTSAHFQNVIRRLRHRSRRFDRKIQTLERRVLRRVKYQEWIYGR